MSRINLNPPPTIKRNPFQKDEMSRFDTTPPAREADSPVLPDDDKQPQTLPKPPAQYVNQTPPPVKRSINPRGLPDPRKRFQPIDPSMEWKRETDNDNICGCCL